MRTYMQYGAPVPQSQPIPGQNMVPNAAGGYSFVLDDWQRLDRFLIIGSEGGTFYLGEQRLTEENATCAIRCIKEDGVRVVQRTAEININNRAPKVDQQLFVLALALKHGDAATKAEVAKVAPKVLRIGTHVLHFAAMLNNLGGWNRSKRRIIKNWMQQDADNLAFNVLKYKSRDGFAMRDLLRLAHPEATSAEHKAVYDWICGRVGDQSTAAPGALPNILRTYETMQKMGGEDPVARAMFGIEAGLPREALPTEALADTGVWKALLPQTPINALVRNLGVLTANGTLAGYIENSLAGERLRDKALIKRQRVHPFALLLAQCVYTQGHGLRGNKSWTPQREIIEALDDAYEVAFDNLVPTYQKLLVCIDISGSMTAPCMGTPVMASTAASAMALTLARTEPHATVVLFDTSVRKIVPVTRRTTLSSLREEVGGGTDVASPIVWATGDKPREHAYWMTDSKALPPKKEFYDGFIILTDNETWAGNIHPAQALQRYRELVNPRARLVCCSMAANRAHVVDNQDPLSLTCVGLDASLPTIVNEFLTLPEHGELNLALEDQTKEV